MTYEELVCFFEAKGAVEEPIVPWGEESVVEGEDPEGQMYRLGDLAMYVSPEWSIFYEIDDEDEDGGLWDEWRTEDLKVDKYPLSRF
jgi:hypothetical protein